MAEDQQYPETRTSNNKRIAKNTIILYIRMIVVTLVSIYTSRVVLQSLGVVDFGIYNVVGGVVAFLGILNSSISAATQRYLNYDLGANDSIRLKKDFSASFNIYAIISIVVIVIGETLGLWFVNACLNIPDERMFAANVVYQFSLFTCVVSLLTSSYNAAVIAHERMDFFAWISITEVFLKLGATYLVMITAYDNLIIYAALIFIVMLGVGIAIVLFSRMQFSECRIQFFYDKEIYGNLASYSGWNLFGTGAGLAMGQGVNILLNIFFGPIVNAARGIAFQVSNAINQFFFNFYTAVRPQIIKYYAEGNYDEMYLLVTRSARFAFYLSIVVSVPIFIEMPYIIQLWLGQSPDYVVVFTRLTVICCLIDCLSNPVITACLASDKIRNYQIAVSFINFMTLPLAYVAIELSNKPESVFVVAIIVAVAALVGRLFFAQKLVGLKMSHYASQVLLRILPIVVLHPIVPYIISLNISVGWQRLLITTCASLIIGFILVLLIGVNHNERKVILRYLRK